MSNTDEDPGGIGPIGRIGSSPATEGAAPAELATASEAVSEVGAPGVADAALAEAIRAGELDAAAATQVLVEAVVREQLGSDASPEAIAALVAELSALLEDDPTLEALLGTRQQLGDTR